MDDCKVSWGEWWKRVQRRWRRFPKKPWNFRQSVWQNKYIPCPSQSLCSSFLSQLTCCRWNPVVQCSDSKRCVHILPGMRMRKFYLIGVAQMKLGSNLTGKYLVNNALVLRMMHFSTRVIISFVASSPFFCSSSVALPSRPLKFQWFRSFMERKWRFIKYLAIK